MRILLFLLVAVFFVILFTNLSPQADMNSTIQRLQSSISTVAYAGEFNEIKTAVDEFMVLRTIQGTPEGDELAAKLDNRINNLQLVKSHCTDEISSMILVHQKNPYKKLQELCPALKDVSLGKAIQLFQMI